MATKSGFHADWNNEYGDQIAKIAACKPALLVSLINPNGPGKAAPAINAARTSIIRHYQAERAMDGTEGNSPTDNAARYWQLVKPIVALYPNSYFAYWRNEVGDDGLLAYHRDEMIAWIQVAEAEGFRVAVGNFSVGVPDFPRWAAVLNPLMAKLHAVGPERALLNLHEYGFGDMTTDAESLALRHRRIWRENGYTSRYGRVRVVIGETGLDTDTRTGRFGPYKAIGVSVEAYAKMLTDYDTELQHDEYVLGAAIYQWGRDATWEAYDIGGPVADSLVTYIQQQGTAPAPVPPPPWVPPVPLGKYETVADVNFRPAPDKQHGTYGILSPGFDVDVQSINGDWAKVEIRTMAYIHKDYIKKL